MVMRSWRFTSRLPTSNIQKLDQSTDVDQHAIVSSQGMAWRLHVEYAQCKQAMCAIISSSCVAYRILHLLQ